MILISNDFWLIIQMYNFDSYNVVLSIATNIPVLLMTDMCPWSTKSVISSTGINMCD